MDWGYGVGICTLRSMEGLANGDLLTSTGSSTQYCAIIYVGRETERMDVCTWIIEPLCCTREVTTAL